MQLAIKRLIESTGIHLLAAVKSKSVPFLQVACCSQKVYKSEVPYHMVYLIVTFGYIASFAGLCAMP